MSGATHSVVVCLAAEATVAPCPDGQAPSVVSAYLLSPSSQAAIDAAIAQSLPVDPSISGVAWVVTFVFTLSLYLVSRTIGQIVRMTR